VAKEAQPPLVWFCIDAAAVDDIDYTAAATLRSLYAILQGQGIRLIFYEVSDEVYAQLERSGMTDLVGRDAFYTTGGEVITAYKETERLHNP
jgi:sulfate permease, SulP family